VSAPLVVYFSGSLTFIQGLRISAVGYAIMVALVFAFYAINPVGAGAGVEGLVSVLSLCLASAVITQLAEPHELCSRSRHGFGSLFLR
jgi:hypothetical protein